MTAHKRIGRYPVIRQIGHGAMGTVFEAFDPHTGEKVAIKILRAEHLADSQADSPAARFGREAQIGLRMRHPNIVAVREHGEHGRVRYIVMEYVPGRELRQLMRERGRFTPADAACVLLQLLDALGHSHEQGIVHRDVKPGNLMVMPPLRIKVMDFGIARIAGSAFTQVGTLLGTLTYMSPEQLCGQPADRGADLWAAGVILYELLAGRPPFVAASADTFIRQAVHEPHPPLAQLQPDLPPGLGRVLDRALAKRREERFRTADEFAAALREATASPGVDLDLDLGAQ